MTNFESKTINHIFSRTVSLPLGGEATTSELFGTDVWDELPVGIRRGHGRVVKRLADRGELPLKPLGPNSANHQRYRKR